MKPITIHSPVLKLDPAGDEKADGVYQGRGSRDFLCKNIAKSILRRKTMPKLAIFTISTKPFPGSQKMQLRYDPAEGLHNIQWRRRSGRPWNYIFAFARAYLVKRLIGFPTERPVTVHFGVRGVKAS